MLQIYKFKVWNIYFFFAADQSLLWSLCLQGELDQERQQHEVMIAAMREEEKFKVDRMARDLEIKWTENLRQVLIFVFISYIRNRSMYYVQM